MSSISDLRESVAEFIEWARSAPAEDDRHVDWQKMNELDGGRGMCSVASHDLAQFLVSRKVWRGVYTAWGRYSKDFTKFRRCSATQANHCVCMVQVNSNELWIVDLTARQFSVDLPFPYFMRV